MDQTYSLNRSFKPTTKRRADLDGPEFYPTPRWASYALVDNEKFSGDIWECACGDGAMTGVLDYTNNYIFSSDLYNRGFGEVGVDFRCERKKFDNIITNPPYHSAQEFVYSCLENARGKFALLLRLAFLEGSQRTKQIFHKYPPSRVWVFSERITFYPKGVQKAGSGTTAYAWFVWDKDHLGQTELRWFEPGYKRKYGD